MRSVSTSIFAALAVLVGLAARAADPKNIFVSSNENWKVSGLEGTTYTDLRTAANQAQTGDTLWIQDGYVYQDGHDSTTRSSSNGGYARVCFPNYAFTVRSESGYVDEARGKGATIRGADDPEPPSGDATCVKYRCGPNAICPIRVMNSSTVVMGLILENGNTPNTALVSGGAAWGVGIYSNCVARNNKAFAGGAFGATAVTCHNCIITNNFAFSYSGGYGGGAIMQSGHYYDCLIASNGTTAAGSAIYCHANDTSRSPYYSNCVFRSNGPSASGGLALFTKEQTRATFVDCTFDDNNGGLSGVLEFRGCTFTNNRGTPVAGVENHYDGGWTYGWAKGRAILSDCCFTNNVSGANGGAANWVTATNCIFSGNRATYNGGGVYKGLLVDCQIVDNVCSNYVTMDSGNGGGLYGCTATNCLIAGNYAWALRLTSYGSGGGAALCNLYNCIVSNNCAAYRGGAVFNPCSATDESETYVCCNCLIVGNTSEAPHVGYDRGMIIEGEWANTLAANPPKFYNCTIVGNSAPNYAIMNDVELYNCIVWNNTAPLGEFYGGQVWAKYTCQKNLAAGTDDHNVNTDPKLTADWHLGSLRACVDRGVEYDWMTAPADCRSRDLDGRPRLTRKAPDLGCYELGHPGVVLRLR